MRSDSMANRKRKPITSIIMFSTADGYKPIEQVSEEELQVWREKIRRDVSTVMSQICGKGE
jgi:hypothetical protein